VNKDQKIETVAEPAPVREMKAIPMADWDEALRALRNGITAITFGDTDVATLCMKMALRLLNPCPF
jgi:hypothetical protein